MAVEKTSAYTLRKQGEYYITIPSTTLETIENPVAVAILVYLLSKDEQWVVRPADIKQRFGLGDFTWRKAASELRQKGFLRIENVQGPGGKILGRNLVIAATPNHNVGDQRHGENHNVDQPRRGSPTFISNDQLLPNKDKEKEKTLSKERATKKREVAQALALERFERWYKDYPRKKNKPDAKKAWLKLDPDDALTERMITDVKTRQKLDATWEDATFICYPATYLRSEVWEDDMTPVKKPDATKTIPRDDNKLEPWAAENGFPSAKGGETYIQYRNRLRGLVEIRSAH